MKLVRFTKYTIQTFLKETRSGGGGY